MVKIQPGYLFAEAPSTWWAKQLCRIIGAKTYHWGMFVMRDGGYWITTESIHKGVTLTHADFKQAYIYRIKGTSRIKPVSIIKIVARYGRCRYDWNVAFKAALWWLAKHYFGKVIPRWHDEAVNCQEWVVLLASGLDVLIIPLSDYPMCTNLERSPYLEYIGEFNEQ